MAGVRLTHDSVTSRCGPAVHGTRSPTAQSSPGLDSTYRQTDSDVNKARGVKAKVKASKPRPRPETCKAKAQNGKVNFRLNATAHPLFQF